MSGGHYNYLCYTIEDMYEGELCIMGDPSIKPFDSMCFNDIYEDMNGTVEVETVIHSLNASTGFTTTIVPDIITCTESIEERVGEKSIMSKFITAAGVGVSRKAASSIIGNLPSYITEIGAGKVAKEGLITAAKKKIGTVVAECLGAAGKEVVVGEVGLGLAEAGTASAEAGAGAMVAGGLLSNPVGIAITVALAAGTYIFCQNVKDLLYRTLNLTAIKLKFV